MLHTRLRHTTIRWFNKAMLNKHSHVLQWITTYDQETQLAKPFPPDHVHLVLQVQLVLYDGSNSKSAATGKSGHSVDFS